MNKQDIYKSIIVSNSTKPNNFVKDHPQGYEVIKSKSTTCSDEYSIYIKQSNDEITDVLFSGNGCSISLAALNIISNYIKNKTIEEAKELILEYKKVVAKKDFNKKIVKDLIAFENISQHLNRVSCALLASNVILTFLGGEHE